MKPEISFSEATKEDIPLILKMMTEFNDHFDYSTDIAKRESNLEEFLGENLGRIWLIEYQLKKCGYIAICFGYSFEYGGKDAFIDEFYIRPDYQSKGIGTETLHFVEKEVQELGIQALHLEVEESNKIGKSLYLKQGYEGNQRNLLTKRIE